MRTQRQISKDVANTEATVKLWVKEVLKEYNVYYLMPVQSGLGSTGVDFHCVVKFGKLALAFFIETKRFGKELTERQFMFASARLRNQGALTFVIDGRVGVNKLRAWLEQLKQASEEDGQVNGNT